VTRDAGQVSPRDAVVGFIAAYAAAHGFWAAFKRMGARLLGKCTGCERKRRQ
jgi:hypothetical protein